MMTAVIWMCF